MTIFEMEKKLIELKAIRNNAWQNGITEEERESLDNAINSLIEEIAYETYCENIGWDY